MLGALLQQLSGALWSMNSFARPKFQKKVAQSEESSPLVTTHATPDSSSLEHLDLSYPPANESYHDVSVLWPTPGPTPGISLLQDGAHRFMYSTFGTCTGTAVPERCDTSIVFVRPEPVCGEEEFCGRDFAIAVLSSGATEDRLKGSVGWILRAKSLGFYVHVFTPNQPSDTFPNVLRDLLVVLDVEDPDDHLAPSAKNISHLAILHLMNNYPRQKWVGKFDDDAYVYPENLIHELNLQSKEARLRSGVPHLFEVENKTMVASKLLVDGQISGGAGYIMTQKAASEGIMGIEHDSKNCWTNAIAEDTMWSHCISAINAGAEFINLAGMYIDHPDQVDAGRFKQSSLEGASKHAISFHWLNNIDKCKLESCRAVSSSDRRLHWQMEVQNPKDEKSTANKQINTTSFYRWSQRIIPEKFLLQSVAAEFRMRSFLKKRDRSAIVVGVHCMFYPEADANMRELSFIRDLLSASFGLPVKSATTEEEKVMPDVLLVGVWADVDFEFLSKARSRSLVIFVNGENTKNGLKNLQEEMIHDVHVSFGSRRGINHSSYHRMPWWLPYATDTTEFCAYHPDLRKEQSAEEWRNREGFAAILSRHEAYPRPEIFSAMSTISRVDAPSVGFHNMEWQGNTNTHLQGKTDFLRAYRYNICPENGRSFHDGGYNTEKVPQALMGGSVPIYWGDTPLEPQVFNQNRIIEYADGDENSVVKVVKLLENNETFRSEWFSRPKLEETAERWLDQWCYTAINRLVDAFLTMDTENATS